MYQQTQFRSKATSSDYDFGNAVQLNGSSCYKVFTYQPIDKIRFFDINQPKKYTIEGWFRKESMLNPLNPYYLLTFEDRHNTRAPWSVYIQNYRLNFTASSVNYTYPSPSHESATVASTTVLPEYPNERWIHFAAIRNVDKILLYLDGKFEGESSFSQDTNLISLGGGDFNIGCRTHFKVVGGSPRSWIDGYFIGKLDEIRISDSIRYPDPNHTGFDRPNAPFYLDYSTQALWKFNETNGGVYDWSNNRLYASTIGIVSYVSSTVPTPTPTNTPTPTPTPTPTNTPTPTFTPTPTPDLRPVFTTIDLPPGIVKKSYKGTFTVSDPLTSKNLTITMMQKPEWMKSFSQSKQCTYDASGSSLSCTLTGTPKAIGNYSGSISASNNAGSTGKPFIIRITK